MISGRRSFGNLRSSCFTVRQRQSSRSSNRSGGLCIPRATLRSADEAITPTIFGGAVFERLRVFTVLYIERSFVEPGAFNLWARSAAAFARHTWPECRTRDLRNHRLSLARYSFAGTCEG